MTPEETVQRYKDRTDLLVMKQHGIIRKSAELRAMMMLRCGWGFAAEIEYLRALEARCSATVRLLEEVMA